MNFKSFLILAFVFSPSVFASGSSQELPDSKVKTLCAGLLSAEENPEWIDPAPFQKGPWARIGSQWLLDLGQPYIRYFVDEENKHPSVETEPFEIAPAEWPHLEGRARNGYLIRNRHTGTIVVQIHQANGWMWDVSLRNFLVDKGEKIPHFAGYTLAGSFVALFKAMNRYSLTYVQNH